MAQTPTRRPAFPVTPPGPGVPTRLPAAAMTPVGASAPTRTPAAPMTPRGNGYPIASRSPTMPAPGPSFPAHSPPPEAVGQAFPTHSPAPPVVGHLYPANSPPPPLVGAGVPTRRVAGIPAVGVGNAYPVPERIPQEAPVGGSFPVPARIPQSGPPGNRMPTAGRNPRAGPITAADMFPNRDRMPGPPGRNAIVPTRRQQGFGPGVGLPRWRQRLRIASFKGVEFYVEQKGRTSGARTVLHQYPKRNIPYAESMGREAIHYAVTGYLIQSPTWPSGNTYYGMDPDYSDQRDILESVLMDPVPGILIDPNEPFLYVGYSPLLFMCDKFTIVEQREKGGFCSIEMSFVEAGVAGMSLQMTNTGGAVASAADNASAAAAAVANRQLTAVNTPGVPLPAFEE
jgi:DNA circularisation protein